MAIRDTLNHPDYLGFQVDWPVFVKVPFSSDGKDWKKNDEFEWKTRKIEPRSVASLYNNGFLHHDKSKEVTYKMGDRLNEMNSDQLYKVYSDINALVKDRCGSTLEFKKKKCKASKIDDKQRGLIRQFLRGNPDLQEEYDKIKERVLG